ncbi:MAG: hypothetical protein JXA66_02715, partial [Oligoflexia bacterium]|nr:hypothetical protein [Oligoflexia bacterium]
IDNYSTARGFWKAADGNFYMCDKNNCSGIKLVDVSGTSYSISDVNGTLSNNGRTMSMGSSYIANFGTTRTIAIEKDKKLVFELYNSATNTVSSHELTGFDTITAVASDDSYYYLAGEDTSGDSVVMRCEITTHTCPVYNTKFGTKYEVNRMEFLSDGRLFFGAVRKSDGVYVTGIWEEGEDLEVIADWIGTELIDMEDIR